MGTFLDNWYADVKFPMFDLLLIFLGGFHRYKFDYIDVAAKSRCVAGIVNIPCNINTLCWSGRRDSNPRPSAPKTDQAVCGTLLKSSDFKCLL